MEPFLYYTNSGRPWDETEDNQLTNEYVNQKYDIIKIAYIHKRTPGGICYRLKTLRHLDDNHNAPGYFEYKHSALYQEIVSMETKKRDTESKKNEPQKVSKSQPNITIQNNFAELVELKDEVKEMNLKLNYIMRLLDQQMKPPIVSNLQSLSV
jgi:hypothetical protein